MNQAKRTDIVLAVEKFHSGPALLSKGGPSATAEAEVGYNQRDGVYGKITSHC